MPVICGKKPGKKQGFKIISWWGVQTAIFFFALQVFYLSELLKVRFESF